MSVPAPLDRAAVIAILSAFAPFGERGPAAADDEIGSLELTWLVTEVEQRYGVTVELSEDELDGIETVDDAVRVIGAALRAPARTTEGR